MIVPHLGLLIVFAGLPAAASAAYLMLLSIAGVFYRKPGFQGLATHRLVILIPAHNEEDLIQACIHSCRHQSYPHELYRVIVVADNCTDGTAIAAQAAGAEVMVRHAPEARGKGQALRWAFDRLLEGSDAADAFVVVDADSVVDESFLEELEAAFGDGRQVLQADDLLLAAPGNARDELASVALLLRNRVRFLGRAALGMPATLCGNGMLFSREVLLEHPWDAFSGTEDGEYSLRLRQLGIPTHFVGGARVFAATTTGDRGAYTQGLRWEGGRLRLMRTWVPRLLSQAWRSKDPGLLNTAFDLAVPPFGLLVALSVVGLAAAEVLTLDALAPGWSVVPWLVAVILLPAYVLVAMAVNNCPPSTYRSLLAIPWFAFLKLRVYAGLAVGSHAGEWVRTQRPSDTGVQVIPRP